MILKINKDYFKNLEKGTHNISVGFTNGKAEGSFVVDDKITFYLHEEEQFPFTATKGMNWAQWIASYGMSATGNNIIWVGFDNETIYIDPRTDQLGDYYRWYELGSDNLILLDTDTYKPVKGEEIIKPNGVYGTAYCCFDAGTQVLMADGTSKNIEDVLVGDEVVSYNEETNEFENDKVIKTIIKENSDDLVYLNLSNGQEIGMRAYHPLLTLEGWKSLRPQLAQTIKEIGQKVQELQIGDVLVGVNDFPTVIEIINRETPANYNTYNLTIEKNHNYIVNGIVAHNASCVVSE